MNSEMKNFLKDFLYLIQETYNKELELSNAENHQGDHATIYLVYWQVLELLQNQLLAFGYDPKEFGTVLPEFRKPTNENTDSY